MHEKSVPVESQPIALLAGDAWRFGAKVTSLTTDTALLSVPVVHTDGYTERYELVAKDRGAGRITVGEVKPIILPTYCPERHVNADGSFCLSWSEDVDLAVTDADGAGRWWASLWQFLLKQRRAERGRRWPDDGAWAHGGAAVFQRDAEHAAARLGPEFAAALKARRIHVTRTKYQSPVHGPVLHVLRHERFAYAVWERSLKATNKQQACICVRGDVKRHRRLRNCEGTHGADADQLAKAVLSWERAETEFWSVARAVGRTCCGTIDRCPLREPPRNTS